MKSYYRQTALIICFFVLQVFCSSKGLRDLDRFEVSLCFLCRKVYPERLEARISDAAKKLKITQR